MNNKNINALFPGSLEIFHKSYDICPDSGCWLWTGWILKSGYGVIYLYTASGLKKRLYAHRYSYTQLKGDIPRGFDLDHYRNNEGPGHAICSKSCVNPEHLEPVPVGRTPAATLDIISSVSVGTNASQANHVKNVRDKDPGIDTIKYVKPQHKFSVGHRQIKTKVLYIAPT